MITESLYKKIIKECEFVLGKKNNDLVYDIAHDLIISDNSDALTEVNYRSKIKYAVTKALSRVNHINYDKIGKDKSATSVDYMCIKCNFILPASEFKDSIRSSGFIVTTNICHECTKKRRLELYHTRYKKTRNCARAAARIKKIKEDKFYRKLETWRQQQRRKNPEYKEKENKARLRRYHERYTTDIDFRERRHKSQKKYRDANKDKRAAYKREWYKKNKEKARLAAKLYRKRAKERGKKDTTAKERMKRFVKKQKEKA